MEVILQVRNNFVQHTLYEVIRVVGLTNVSLNLSDAEFEAFYGIDKLRDVDDNLVPQDSIWHRLQIDFNNGLFWIDFAGPEYKYNRYFLNSLDKRFLIIQESYNFV